MKATGLRAITASAVAAALIALAAPFAPANASSGAALGGAYSCVTSQEPHGTCGPYDDYSRISVPGPNVTAPYVDQNAWANNPGYTSTLHANSPGDWYLTASVETHDGGVQAYPNSGWGMAWPEVAIDSYASTVSTYKESFTHNSKVIAWAAYDLWFNNWVNEVQIQVDFSVNQFYDCTPVASATIFGEPWHLCVFGSELVWKAGTSDQAQRNKTSGTVHIKAMLDWLEEHGYLPKDSTWTQGSFGFEICDTGGTTATFRVSGLSLKATS